MAKLLALDIAILPPLEVHTRATTLSAQLPERESKGLRLDERRLPHITLTQQFVAESDLEAVLTAVDRRLTGQSPLELCVSGIGRGASAVWMAIERTPDLVMLHERLMETLRLFERRGGSRAAFLGGDARTDDVLWVKTYQAKASLLSFTPHITLGHAKHPSDIAPFSFTATTIAACHLGRFCTCQAILRKWHLHATIGSGRRPA